MCVFMLVQQIQPGSPHSGLTVLRLHRKLYSAAHTQHALSETHGLTLSPDDLSPAARFCSFRHAPKRDAGTRLGDYETEMYGLKWWTMLLWVRESHFLLQDIVGCGFQVPSSCELLCRELMRKFSRNVSPRQVSDPYKGYP